MVPSEKTIYEYLKEYAEITPDKPLFCSGGQTYTAADVLEIIQELASELLFLGVSKNNYVALRMIRSIKASFLFLALQAIGAVSVLTDPHQEAWDFISDKGKNIPVRFFITCGSESCDDEQPWVLADRRTSEKKPLTLIRALMFPYSKKQPQANVIPKQYRDEKLLSSDSHTATIVIFTSGSTGECKAVALSQYGCINNLENSRFLGGYLPDDIALCILPLHHVFGLALLLGAVILKHTLFFPKATDTKSILAAMEEYKITRLNAVPSLYLALSERAENYNLQSLHAGFIGGAPCTPE